MPVGILFYKNEIDGPWQSIQMKENESAREWAAGNYHSGGIARTTPVFFWSGKVWHYATWDGYADILIRGVCVFAYEVPAEIKLQALVLGGPRG